MRQSWRIKSPNEIRVDRHLKELFGGKPMSKQIRIIKGTEHTEEFDHSKQKDRPDREKIIETYELLSRQANLAGLHPQEFKEKLADQILALFPDYKTYISKLISDHQEAISNLRIEIAEAKKQGAIDWIEKHRAKVSVFATFDTEGVEDSVLIKVKDLQALKGEK